MLAADDSDALSVAARFLAAAASGDDAAATGLEIAGRSPTVFEWARGAFAEYTQVAGAEAWGEPTCEDPAGPTIACSWLQTETPPTLILVQQDGNWVVSHPLFNVAAAPQVAGERLHRRVGQRQRPRRSRHELAAVRPDRPRDVLGADPRRRPHRRRQRRPLAPDRGERAAGLDHRACDRHVRVTAFPGNARCVGSFRRVQRSRRRWLTPLAVTMALAAGVGGSGRRRRGRAQAPPAAACGSARWRATVTASRRTRQRSPSPLCSIAVAGDACSSTSTAVADAPDGHFRLTRFDIATGAEQWSTDVGPSAAISAYDDIVVVNDKTALRGLRRGDRRPTVSGVTVPWPPSIVTARCCSPTARWSPPSIR